MRRAFARWRRRTVWGLPAPDVTLAVALLVVAAASVLTGNPDEGPLGVTLPVAAATTLAIAWRRRSPWVPIAVVVVAGTVQTLVSTSPGSLWALVVDAVALYSAAAYLSEAVAAIAGAVFVAALLAQERIDNGVDYVFILLLFGAIWLLGRASAQWRGRVGAAERRQREAARLAVAEERVRIARDLHDVVAHSLSVIAVQSDAAEAALKAAPERAIAPVQAVRTTAREALADIRRMLDVLRTDDAELPGVDSPGVSAVAGLADAARATGTPVTLDVRLTSGPVPPGVDLAAYRIVQESLTNARRHAPGAPVIVAITQQQNALEVRITSAAASTPSAEPHRTGYGINGMRERAATLGGTLVAGPTPDGGFDVHATLPLPTTTETS